MRRVRYLWSERSMSRQRHWRHLFLAPTKVANQPSAGLQELAAPILALFVFAIVTLQAAASRTGRSASFVYRDSA